MFMLATTKGKLQEVKEAPTEFRLNGQQFCSKIVTGTQKLGHDYWTIHKHRVGEFSHQSAAL